MFSTDHLEGRLCYETDKVVCINVYLAHHITKDYFVTQILLSLVNSTKYYVPINVVTKDIILKKEQISKEIEEGILKYLKLRKLFEL